MDQSDINSIFSQRMSHNIVKWLQDLQARAVADTPLTFDSHLAPPHLQPEIRGQIRPLYEDLVHHNRHSGGAALSDEEVVVAEILETALLRSPDLLRAPEYYCNSILHAWVHGSMGTVGVVPPETLRMLCELLIVLVTKYVYILSPAGRN